jgi:two-component system, sensor histidine kinase
MAELSPYNVISFPFSGRTRLGSMEVARHPTSDDLRHALDPESLRKETFVSVLAHEIRQPLSALLTCVEVVRLASNSIAVDRATAIMQRQIGQMNRMLEDLLDAARWASGKMTLRKERIDLRGMVDDAALDVRSAVAERRHELVVTTGLEPLWVDADPQRLHQVLSNLLRNAVKYTDPGGRISLGADRNATTITLRVCDTGRGIEPGALKSIFDLFSQVRPLETRGLGVGLSVARDIVALHDGWIEARSPGLGRGSEFIVCLPLAPGPARLGEPSPFGYSVSSSGSLR